MTLLRSPLVHRVTLIFAATIWLAACTPPPANDTEMQATVVRAALSTVGPSQPPIEASGLLGSKDEMRLSFKTGGIVARISVAEGSRIERGAVLAELDLTEISAQFAQANAAAEKAGRDLLRGERLHADQVISLEALENLRTQATMAAAARDAAQFNLGYSKITAPRHGTVLRRFVEEREFVLPGQPVLTLGSSERGLVVRAAVADRDIVQIALGDRASVRLDAYRGREFAARVSEKSAAADPRTGLFPIELELDGGAELPVSSGLIAKITIIPSTATDRTLTYVPIGAIVEGRGEQAFVFVVEGEVARKRSVGVAFIDATRVALREGLLPETRVVTDGALYLRDGERVRIVDESAQSQDD